MGRNCPEKLHLAPFNLRAGLHGGHTHLLSLSLFSEWTSELFIDLFPALSLSISCWSYPDPLAVSWPWAITYLTISIKLV